MAIHNPTSICQFPSPNKDDENNSLLITNFVYEPKPLNDKTFMHESTFIVYIVISGKINFSTDYKDYSLRKGDVFFVFPNKRYKKYNCKKAKLIYISFTNVEANNLINSLKIKYVDPVRSGLRDEIPFILKSFNRSLVNESSQLIPKSLLLYIMSFFTQKDEENVQESSLNKEQSITEILKFINKHFAEDISLDYIAKKYYISYNYLSIKIKEITGTPYSKYLNNIRMAHAKQLLKEKKKSITEVSSLVGFSDSRYFAKQFKKFAGITPSEYKILKYINNN